MADRSVWKGNISLLGGISLIPIKLVKATDSHDVTFHEYHIDDRARVGRKSVCKGCGKELDKADIIKGIEVSKDTVVTFTEQELDNLPLNTLRTIEVDNFVDADQINPLLFESAYYIIPEDIGIKSFVLFMNGLKRLNKIAIGKFAMRGREHLCAIRPINNGVILSTLFYSDEIRPLTSLPSIETNDTLVDMLEQAINKFSKSFKYEDYQDTYTAAIKTMAQAKLQGKETTQTPIQTKTKTLEEALATLLKEDK